MGESETWGIGGASFLWLYAGGFVVIATAAWLLRSSLLNTGDGTSTPLELDVYELAMLNGGPELAVTTAATKLHHDGALLAGSKGGTVEAGARPEHAADLETEVYDAVARTSGLSSRQLRRELEQGLTIMRMERRLVDAGLLLEDGRRMLVNSLWALFVPLLLVGGLRLIDGAQNDRPVLFLLIALAVTGFSAKWLGGRRTRATARGSQLLEARREGRSSPAHTPVGAEIPMAVALFGVAALWAADPAIAAAWSIPRESGGGGSGGGGCGSGGGCGGCGGCGG